MTAPKQPNSEQHPQNAVEDNAQLEFSYDEQVDPVVDITLDEGRPLVPSGEDRIELPQRGRTNWQTLSAREIDATWSRLTPEERENRLAAKSAGIAAIKASVDTPNPATNIDIETNIETVEPRSGREIKPYQAEVVGPNDTTEEPASQKRRNLQRRNAFGSAISLEYYGIDPDSLVEVTEEELALVDVDNMRSALFSRNGRFKVNGLSLIESEYTTIVRNTQSFGTAVMAKTFEARGLDKDLDNRTETSERSVKHAFSSKEEAISKMLEGYRQEQNRLVKLQREIRSPGFAHMDEFEMRLVITNVTTLSFLKILDVVSSQLEWDGQTREAAQSAMTRKMLTGPQRDKVSYWGQLTELAMTYNKAEQTVSKHRLAQIRRQLS
jgi:hypothetical protein